MLGTQLRIKASRKQCNVRDHDNEETFAQKMRCVVVRRGCSQSGDDSGDGNGGGRESVCSDSGGERNGEREAKVGQNHAAAAEAEDERGEGSRVARGWWVKIPSICCDTEHFGILSSQ